MAIREGKRNGDSGGLNYSAIQVAKVKDTEDEYRSGRMRVWLMNSNTNENDESNWISIKYSSPSAGVSDPAGLDSVAVESSAGTQTSFGMYAGSPAKENVVIVAFGNGEPQMGYYLAGTFPDGMNYGVPGRAAANTYQGGGKPAAEMNRHSQQLQAPQQQPQRPELDGNAAALDEQGLAGDELLGAGNSSMTRDKSPKVQGWLSPGGNQFIMDDGDGYQLIRLRTASGVQLLLSETTGDIFLINKSGNGWSKFGNGGEIDHYGSVSVNIFGGADVNIKSGGNINLDGDADINVKAAATLNLEGADVNIKGGSIKTSKITGDISYADFSGIAVVLGGASPVGDVAGAAGSVSRTPARGGKAG